MLGAARLEAARQLFVQQAGRAARLEVDLARERDRSTASEVKADKTAASASKLQELCRELQRQNKMIGDDAQHRLDAEILRRKDVTDKFSGTIDV